MSDLIDRQELLRQIDIDADGEPGYYGDTWKFIDTIKSMPSAELGTNLAEVGTDCISRQAAIDALNKLSESTYEVDYGVVDCDDAINAIATLPPTEPKKGKWIKTARWGRVYYCNQCRNYLDFDGVNAGRGSTNFCPNCGADMREVTR